MKQTYVDLCWLQTLSGGGGVLQERIPASDALSALEVARQQAAAGELGAGVVVYLRPSNDLLSSVQIELSRLHEDEEALRSGREAFGALHLVWLDLEFIMKTGGERLALRNKLIHLAATCVQTVEDLEL